MTKLKLAVAVLAATYGMMLIGCGGEEPRRRPRAANEPPAGAPVAVPAGTEVAAAPAASAPAAGGAVSGWGTIKGRFVWTGATPEAKPLEVTKDTDWCLKNGPIPDETNVIDPDTKGVGNVFVYLIKPKGIHESYPKDKAAVAEAAAKAFAEQNGGVELTADAVSAAVAAGKVELKNLKAPALIDQVHCRYVPHAIGVREGEPTVVLNYETIAHNVKVASVSGKNDANPNMPPNTLQLFNWSAEAQPLNVECSIHGWMKMYAMVFDHPYFVVSGKDGSFEIKNVPAGDNAIVLRNPKFLSIKEGGKGSARGEKITVEADKVLDLGEIKVQ